MGVVLIGMDVHSNITNRSRNMRVGCDFLKNRYCSIGKDVVILDIYFVIILMGIL